MIKYIKRQLGFRDYYRVSYQIHNRKGMVSVGNAVVHVPCGYYFKDKEVKPDLLPEQCMIFTSIIKLTKLQTKYA